MRGGKGIPNSKFEMRKLESGWVEFWMFNFGFSIVDGIAHVTAVAGRAFARQGRKVYKRQFGIMHNVEMLSLAS